jgi:uncharacterized OB-fold protein
MCSTCGSFDLTWESVNPAGKVYSFVVQHQRTGGRFDADLPFAAAVVTLTDEPHIRLFGRLVDVAVSRVHIEMPVIGHYLDVTDEVTLLVFRPAASDVRGRTEYA